MIKTARNVSVHVSGVAKDEICNIHKDMEMPGDYKSKLNKTKV